MEAVLESTPRESPTAEVPALSPNGLAEFASEKPEVTRTSEEFTGSVIPFCEALFEVEVPGLVSVELELPDESLWLSCDFP
jgi:hypothetical protein